MLRKCFPSNLCRLCGLEKSQGTDVNSPTANKTGLLSKINKRLSKEGIHIAIGDKLPKFICSECEVIINNFTEFCRMVNQVQKRLEQEKLSFKEISQKSFDTPTKPLREELNQQKISTVSHDLTENNATVSIGPDGKIECKMCQNFLEAVEHTTLHMVTHGIGTVICQCRICGHIAELAQFLRSSNGREEKNTVWCENCQFQSATQNIKGAKSKNKKVKHKIYRCEICSKIFHSKAHLSRHQIVHSGAKPYLCEVCGTGFSQKSSLKLHVLSHTGLNPHKCDECGQCFRFKSSLQSHVMSLHWPNTGTSLRINKRVYSCDHCGKQFATAYKLGRHYRCHTGERPYECGECGRLFSQSCNLNLHRKKHRQSYLNERKQSLNYETVSHKDHLPDALPSNEQFTAPRTSQQSSSEPSNTVSYREANSEVLDRATDPEFLNSILQNPVVSLEVANEPLNSIDTVLLDPTEKSPGHTSQFVPLRAQFTSRSSHLTPEYLNIGNEAEKKLLVEKTDSDLFPDFTHEEFIYINQTSNLQAESPSENVSLPTFSSLQTGPTVSLPNLPH